MVQRFAQVVLTREHERLNRLFSYLVPDSLCPELEIGSRVWVPFGGEHLEGFVVEITESAEVNEVKEIAQVLGKGPVFSPEQIALARWMAEYYICPLIRALKAMIPPASPSRGKTTVSLVPLGEEDLIEMIAYWEKMQPAAAQILTYLSEKGEIPAQQLSRLGIVDWEDILKKLDRQGLLQLENRPVKRKEPDEDKRIVLSIKDQEARDIVEQMRRRAPRQAELMEILLNQGPLPLTDLVKKLGVSRQTLRVLLDKGFIKKIAGPALDPENSFQAVEGSFGSFNREPTLDLTPEQKQALEYIRHVLIQVDAGIQAPPIVLHGVTGSGKTEVYLQAIESVLNQGRTAIVLVPEISLTPQTAERFRQRFGPQVAVMHSRMTLKERQYEWSRLKEGIVDIVVGARSALFAPLDRLGLIVLDEEHENSYKQDAAPRYHAREVAIKRAELTGAVVLLGSATPTLETYYQTQKGPFHLLELTKRVESRPLPKIEVVDLRQELKEGNRSMFSRLLQTNLAEVLHKGEQAILFLNRRGFSSFVNCRSCGLVMRCSNCAVSLTYHSPNHLLRCHYCNYQRQLPPRCPECGSNYLRHFGIGTQRVEEEVRSFFPEARILRVDVDTTTGRDSYAEFFQAFKGREIDILVGTQLIAKGLDFPGVTLVGVITADTSLNLPDFRAAERTFQLLTQVAGRAGRGDRLGKVILQTYSPEHYSVLTAQYQDFKAFYRAEIQNRIQWQYPPCWAMVRVLVSGISENQVQMAAELLGRYLEKRIVEKNKNENIENLEAGFNPLIEVLGPSAAPLIRIRGNYRWQMLVKGEDRSLIRKVVQQAILDFKENNQGRQVNVVVDVDPVNVL
jgi:primosomal protein N' (replication factor Y)